MKGLRLALGARFHRRINRRPSSVVARTVPWLAVMLGSLLPGLLLVASAPVLPPLGFLTMLAWRQLRPGLLPIWAGMPLGFFDDLYSGQPMGSAVLLWSLVMIILEAIETRFPWRSFALEWLLAAALILAYVAACLLTAHAAGGSAPFAVLAPQAVLSVLIYPAIARVVAGLDRFRLIPFVELGR